MRVTACPFCGVATTVPHETQQRCIAALQSEIARVKEMVIRVKESHLENVAGPEIDPQSPDQA